MKTLTSIMLAAFLLMGVPANGLAFEADSSFAAQSAARAQDALVSFQDALEHIVAGSGATISDVALDQSMRGAGESGTPKSSCTASATVGIPGGTEVSLSATASTCAAAIAMVMEGVQSLLDKIGQNGGGG